MPESSVWVINIATNIGLGLLMLGIIKWFLTRFIEDLDKRFKEIKERVEDTENDIDNIKTNYINRFEDVKEHFTSEISKIIKDKTENRISTGMIISELKTKINHIFKSIDEIKRKIFNLK